MNKKTFLPRFLKNYFVYSFLFTILITTLPKSYGEITISVKQFKEPDNIGHCLTDYISVHYDDLEDYIIACEGIKRVESFYTNHLNDFPRKPVQIIFGDTHDFIDENIREQLINGRMGIYIPQESTLIIKPWRILRHQTYLEYLPISQNLLSSTVAHELSHHFYYNHIKNLGKEVHLLETEFLAAIVQLETMANPERTQILDYPINNGGHPNENNINLIAYEMKPVVFLISVHTNYLKAPDIIQHIFNGQKIWPDLSAPNLPMYSRYEN